MLSNNVSGINRTPSFKDLLVKKKHVQKQPDKIKNDIMAGQFERPGLGSFKVIDNSFPDNPEAFLCVISDHPVKMYRTKDSYEVIPSKEKFQAEMELMKEFDKSGLPNGYVTNTQNITVEEFNNLPTKPSLLQRLLGKN